MAMEPNLLDEPKYDRVKPWLPAKVADSFSRFDAIPEEDVPGYQSETALETQEGGNHYKNMAIQPVEYIHANNIPYFEANVIKYVSRWRSKNGIGDLKKAKHYIDLLIELEGRV